MFDEWIAVSFTQLGLVLFSSFIVYAAILLYTRCADHRYRLAIRRDHFQPQPHHFADGFVCHPLRLWWSMDVGGLTSEIVFGKLREANAFHVDQIIAVVFETTGDVSVIHSTQQSPEILSPFFF